MRVVNVEPVRAFIVILAARQLTLYHPQMTTAAGKKFSVVPIADLVRSDMAQPDLARLVHMERVPDPEVIKEDWDSEKWRSEPPLAAMDVGQELGEPQRCAHVRPQPKALTQR